MNGIFFFHQRCIYLMFDSASIPLRFDSTVREIGWRGVSLDGVVVAIAITNFLVIWMDGFDLI